MRIIIRSLAGAEMGLDVSESDTIEDVKAKIEAAEGIPTKGFKLVRTGTGELENDRTLSAYGITEDSTLHIVFKLMGMISNWTTTDRSVPLTQYLMLSDSRRSRVGLPPTALLQEAEASERMGRFPFGPSPPLFVVLQTGDSLLSATHRRRCMRFLDAACQCLPQGASSRTRDLKVTFQDGDAALEGLLNLPSPLCRAKHKELLALHGRSDTKIALRRTEGPVEGCIGFHCDGAYASETAQLALNDDTDYEGGRLCLFDGERLSIPRRPAGTLTHHKAATLHGVTRLLGGVRYSLFVVDKENGLGDRDVFNLGTGRVAEILAAAQQDEGEQLDGLGELIAMEADGSEEGQNWLEHLEELGGQQKLDDEAALQPGSVL